MRFAIPMTTDVAPCVLETESILTVVSVNISGLLTKKKRLLLGRSLEELQVGVCILIETHLRKSELNWLRVRGFHVVSEACRPTPKGVRIGGGVLILVRNALTTEVYAGLSGVDPAIEHCSIRLFPTDDPRTEIVITGIYVSPANTNRLSLGKLLALSAPQVKRGAQTDCPHLLAAVDLQQLSQRQLLLRHQPGLQHRPDIPHHRLALCSGDFSASLNLDTDGI